VKKRAIILLSFLAGLILACLLLPDQFTQSLRKQTSEGIGPVLRQADKPVSFFRQMNNKLKTLDQAQAEVTRLRAQVAQLIVQNQLLSDKSAENARLREMLGFRAASPYRLRACRVVTREPSNWWATVQVNVGWEDEPNLAKDQPVVSPRGVVGKTGNVSRSVTDVILLVNRNCSISATVEGTKEQGIVQGEGNFEEGQPRVKIQYLPKDSQVAPGQFIVTSGLGPYFPAGLKLGTVVQVPKISKTYPTFGLYREAYIEPTADLNNLDELFIVLGAKEDTKTSDEAKPDESPAKPGEEAPRPEEEPLRPVEEPVQPVNTSGHSPSP
jgi:rod shape-determining protein MreC